VLDPRGVVSRSAGPEQRADLDTISAPYRVGLEPAARHKQQTRWRKTISPPSQSVEQANADDDRRQDQPSGQHAGAAFTLPIACCQASPSVRMRSSPLMAFGNGSGAVQIIQLLHISSQALVQIDTK
jgi:hypothetical protein